MSIFTHTFKKKIQYTKTKVFRMLEFVHVLRILQYIYLDLSDTYKYKSI